MYTTIKYSNLSWYKRKLLIDEWVFQTPARVCARKIHVNRNTVNFWYSRIRRKINALPEPPPFEGIIEIDETYCGQKRPGMKGTGTTDKIAIFGLRERHSGRVWATVVPGTDHTILIPIIQQRVIPGSTIFSDGFGAYYHLTKLGFKHHVVIHAHTYVTSRIVHTNGIESFWAYAKSYLAAKKGLPRDCYQEHPQEILFRYNTRNPQKLRLLVRKMLRSEETF